MAKRFRYVGVWFAVVVAVPAVMFCWRYVANGGINIHPQRVETFEPGRRTLIVAPHPDDETIGGAGVLLKASAGAKQVKIVVMTSGDGYKQAVVKNFGISSPGPEDYIRLGKYRHLETLHAVKHLGVQPEDVVFLCYPDGGVNSLWETNWDPSVPHVGLNGKSRAPYDFCFESHALYSGANVVKNLEKIIRNYRPTDIVYPDPNDRHHDHWATNAFVKYVIAKNRIRVKEWTYLVHHNDFPGSAEAGADAPHDPPDELKQAGTDWIRVPLNEHERKRKRDALHEYKTQVKVMAPFLEAFVRTNDLLAVYPDLTLSKSRRSLTAGDVPTLFTDAYGDALKHRLELFADITSVGAALTKDRFYIRVGTRMTIHKNMDYNIRLRIFRRGSIVRYDLAVLNSSLRQRKHAANSPDLPPHSALKLKNGTILVSLPSDAVDGADRFMLCADTVFQEMRIDKTAWRFVRIKR